MDKLAEIRKIAAERGGECLATEYLGSKSKLRFRCKALHEFDMAPSNVRNMGQWCPYCAGKRIENPLLELQKLAAERGGECLATEYINSSTKLPFRCKVGHEWNSAPTSVKHGGAWCPYCSQRKIHEPLELFREYAKSRGGECLSTEYIKGSDNLIFRCQQGHVFETKSKVIKAHRTWCPICSRRVIPEALSEIQQIAKSKGGECLSNEYISSKIRMQFRCIDGHEWGATANSIRRGPWCPQCWGVSETLVRQFFECVFKESFQPARPKWLKRPGKSICILDGYSEKLKIAFEYNGLQHYEQIKHFHERGYRTLDDQRERDNFVRNKAKENGINLVSISTLPKNYTKVEFLHHVIESLYSATGFTPSKESITEFELLPFGVSQISKLKQLAELKGGNCLSIKYLGCSSNLNWTCSKGHEWESTPERVKQGAWCPYCSGRRIKNPLIELQQIAASKGGECLSTSYEGSKTKMTFRCKDGHEWQASSNSIKSHGTWCPVCGVRKPMKNPLGLMELQQIAASKGGECLSTSYEGSKTKMTFRCKDGHEWQAIPNNIKNGSWCPACAVRGRKPK